MPLFEVYFLNNVGFLRRFSIWRMVSAAMLQALPATSSQAPAKGGVSTVSVAKAEITMAVGRFFA